jgi:hypothetical protein
VRLERQTGRNTALSSVEETEPAPRGELLVQALIVWESTLMISRNETHVK